MCQVTTISKTDRRLVTKVEFSPEVERAFNWLLEEYQGALGPLEDDILGAVESESVDLSTLETIRLELDDRLGEYTADFETVFREGGEQGAQAGRELAARRHALDISFDVVPDRTLAELDDWVDTAAGSTLETITEDATRWLRSAHEEGLSIDELTDQLQSEFFDGHLEDHVARRAARTATISTSNTGSHSAHQDADGVVAERWVTELDGRQRDSHEGADGQVVTVDNTFEVGGVYLAHPGDPSAPVGEIANCRCSVVPVFADELSEEDLEAIEAGDRIRL
jgi:hypothetical protein